MKLHPIHSDKLLRWIKSWTVLCRHKQNLNKPPMYRGSRIQLLQQMKNKLMASFFLHISCTVPFYAIIMTTSLRLIYIICKIPCTFRWNVHNRHCKNFSPIADAGFVKHSSVMIYIYFYFYFFLWVQWVYICRMRLHCLYHISLQFLSEMSSDWHWIVW